jgi:hypothetical protein
MLGFTFTFDFEHNTNTFSFQVGMLCEAPRAAESHAERGGRASRRSAAPAPFIFVLNVFTNFFSSFYLYFINRNNIL